jgi:hypothetical protein
MPLKIPRGAEAAFRIGWHDVFGAWLAIHVYGAGAAGWFVATLRSHARNEDSGVRYLPDGEWPMLLQLIERCGFWSLPEDEAHLVEPNTTVDDGDVLTIAGRDRERYHKINRFVWREPELDALLEFGRRVSGFYVRHPRFGWVLAEPPAPDAGGRRDY